MSQKPRTQTQVLQPELVWGYFQNTYYFPEHLSSMALITTHDVFIQL